MNNVQKTINLLLKDNNISKQIRNLSEGFKGLDGEVRKLNQTIGSTSSVLSGKLSEVGNATKAVDNVVDKTADNMKRKFGDVNFSNTVSQVRNISDALNTMLSPSLSFQQAMANISASTGVAGSDLEELGELARQTGVSTGEGAAAAATAFATLASQVKINKVGLEGLKTLQAETATLAQASGLSMNEAATVLAGTVDQFGLGADEAARVVNVLAAGSMAGAAGVNDLAASFSETARTAADSGLSLEETAGALELLSQNDLKGAEAGKALNSVLSTLRTSMGEGLADAGLAAALQTLQPLLADTASLTRLFGAENAGVAAFLIDNAAALDGMAASLTGTNAAQEQAAIRSDTVAERIERMKATIDNVKLSLFDATGGLTGYVSVLGDSAVTAAQLLPLLSGLKGMMASMGVVQKAAAAATTVWTAAQRALNVAMKANPVGLLVTAGMALVGVVTAAYNRFDGFRRVVDGCMGVVTAFGSSLMGAVVAPFRQLLEGFDSIGSALVALVDGRFSEAADKAREGAAQIGRSLLDLNPASAVARAAAGADLAGAWKKGVEGKASLAVEVIPEGDDEAIRRSVEELAKGLAPVEAPLLTPALATASGVRQLAVAADTGKGAGGRLEAPPLAAVAGLADIETVTGQMDAFNESLQANQELAGSQGEAWAGWTERMQGVADSMASLQENLARLTEGMLRSFSKGAESLASFGENVGETIRNTISAVIALGVSYLVMNALQSAAATGPFGFLVAAGLAALAGGLASSLFNSLVPSFANGGIVYGNTLAQVGEYPGAANNPEVIAPLNKLRALIQPAFNPDGGSWEFRMKGRDMVAIYNKLNNLNNRTR